MDSSLALRMTNSRFFMEFTLSPPKGYAPFRMTMRALTNDNIVVDVMDYAKLSFTGAVRRFTGNKI